jgi:hypothetical protein
VSLEGAERDDRDQADVLACEVMGIAACSGNGTWPHKQTLKHNERAPLPDPVGAVALAWRLYRQRHPNCSTAQGSVMCFERLAKQLSGAAANPAPPLYVCTDYSWLEARARNAVEGLLGGAACVRHRSPPPAQPPPLSYCDIDPARLVKRKAARATFAKLCSGVPQVGANARPVGAVGREAGPWWIK